MVFFSMEVYGAKSTANVTTSDGNCGCYESGRFWLCHEEPTLYLHFTTYAIHDSVELEFVSTSFFIKVFTFKNDVLKLQ